ncbi:hypothetical protein [Acinetobacter johnsonii]|nr:hypothetical protein [Acinetobacter johnsonii]QQV07922.1 hypothetical protein I6I49_01040 [Acinetobacter johnsonii]
MPVQYVGFKLQPNNFFELNPAMDLPAGKDHASVQDGASIAVIKTPKP